MEAITKTKYDNRLEFLPYYVGNKFLQYEMLVYDQMLKASKQYDGGYWEYYTLSNSGFYMELQNNESFEMECLSNYYNGKMSAEAASIAVNLCVQNLFAWQVNPERFSDAFHLLRDYASQHEEAREIFGFID